MTTTGRKNLAVLGGLFTAGLLLALAGAAWVVLDRHHFFSESVRASRCAQRLAAVAAAKAEVVREHQLAAGAPVPAEAVADLAEGGWEALRCPSGGDYQLNPAGQPPACPRHPAP